MKSIENMTEKEMQKAYIEDLTDYELQDLNISILVEMHKRGFIDPTYARFKTYVDGRMKK